MKILVLYSMAGGGHKSAALAAKSCIEAELPQAEVRAEDGLALLSRGSNAISWAFCNTYEWSARNWPQAFGFLYREADHQDARANVVPAVNAALSRWLLPYLEDYRPDVIVCTYHFLAHMVSALKEKGLIKSKLVTLITDYAPCMPWIVKNTDAYVVADEALLSQMEQRGVPEKKVYPFGIPVRAEFFQKKNRADLRKELNLNRELPTVLLMGGSFGVKKVLEIFVALNALELPLQIVAIAGKDKELERGLRHAALGKRHPTRVLGFCKEVEKYMGAADILVSKPGGMSMSEALACGVPIVAYDAVPGQEEDNIAFLLEKGLGVYARAKDCAQVVCGFLEAPQELAKLSAACAAFNKSACLKKLPALLKELAESP